MPAVGDTLGRYDLLARLRAGGMATLYLGKRVGAAGFARPVAIKVIHPHLAEDPRFVQMFVDEATLSAKIDDPHVVHVEELGEANGTYFLVMEYVDGASLAELLRMLGRCKRALSVELAVWIAGQIAAGLHAAHEATNESGEPLGIVHRDVSPHNVLLAFKGHVKLIDFGIAKARGRPGDTQTGSLRGKLAYMPPEQAYGKSVDRRADVYALGVVLWEMLTMRRLFDADNDLALLERVRNPQITPPGALVTGIPPALDAVVMAALAHDPAARPATAEELRARLVAAVPTANIKTAKDLAAVITAIMPDLVKRSRERLVEALGDAVQKHESVPALPAPPDDEALATMTVTMPEAVALFEEEQRQPLPQPVQGTTVRTGGRGPGRVAMVLAGLAAVSISFLVMAVTITLRRPAAASAGSSETTTSLGASATVAGPPVLPPPALPTEAVAASSPAPPAASATAATPTATTASHVARSPAGRRTPKTAHPSTPSAAPGPATTSSVEMHGGTPIFKKSL